MNIEDLDNPDWVPDEILTCPVCQVAYPFEWDSLEESWWPGSAQWWQLPSKGIRFLCSRTCYLVARSAYFSMENN